MRNFDFNVSMRNLQARPLPRDRYVNKICRRFYWERDVDYCTIAARHLTDTVRHVMYRFGMMAILE